MQRHPIPFDEPRTKSDISAGDGVFKGFFFEAVGFKPMTGATMKGRDPAFGGRGLFEALTQQSAKKMMIPIPSAFVVERNDKEVRLDEKIKRCLC